jgi:hypothetical protein
MSSFTKPLIVSPLSDGETWELVETFSYYRDDGTTYTVPKGFKTDFASVPQMFWAYISPTGKHGKAAVLHDYLYSTKIVSRKEADKIFLEAMKVLGVAKWKRGVMYYAVRLFGGKHYKG